MTLTQLRYLVAIADSGLNITQAAERVHATQPGLSKQLKQLEDELGFQLFSRKGRSLESIAPAGVRVIDLQDDECIAMLGDWIAAHPQLWNEDIAAQIYYVATLPAHLNINRLEIMPVTQSFAGFQVFRG